MAKHNPEPVAPEQKPDPNGRGTIETHPAYALIRASRISCNPGTVLFGSDFRHRQYVTLEIATADRRRDLSNDWVHGDLTPMIRVGLSEAQWATFVSSLNVGEGAPCTLERVGQNMVPEILQLTDRRQQFRDELTDHLDLVKRCLVDLGKQIEATTLSGKKKADLHSLLHTAVQNLGVNLDFVAEQFDEHMEATVEKAKAEIQGHIGSVLAKKGLQALADGMPTPALPMLMEGEVASPDVGKLAQPEPPDDLPAACCDVASEAEYAAGQAASLKLHRWAKPVHVGDRCYCGQREADLVVANVLNGGGQ